MNRKEILETASEYVTKDRQATHGSPENSFGVIATMWMAYLQGRGLLAAAPAALLAVDVANMLELLKIARRSQNLAHVDNYVDGAGYAACAGELAEGLSGDSPLKRAIAAAEAEKFQVNVPKGGILWPGEPIKMECEERYPIDEAGEPLRFGTLKASTNNLGKPLTKNKTVDLDLTPADPGTSPE